MKIRRLFFVLFAVVVIIGCKPLEPRERETEPRPLPSPREEPLTPGNLERLQEMEAFTHIKDYQFVLANQIRLNLVKNDNQDHNNQPIAGAVFENLRTRNQITFPDKSLGEALDVNSVGDKYVLRVYFEIPADESKYPAATHFLSFSARRSEQSAYFYLDHDSPRPDTLSEEKGTLKYGSETYALLFDERPYILMRLERKNDTGESNRTVGGRKVVQPDR